MVRVIRVGAVVALVAALTGCGDRPAADPHAELKAKVAACDQLAGFAERSTCWAQAVREEGAGR